MSEGEERRFFGKYRSAVLSNIDPLQKGRLLLQCLDVDGLLPTTWALPCLPFVGRQMGMWALPQIGAGVWVEFEQGDPDYPIWSGCFWGATVEMPETGIASPPPTPNIVMQTTGRNSMTIFGAPGGGLMLCAGLIADPTSPRIMITKAGIVLSCGPQNSIAITPGGINISGQPVNINLGALLVT